MTGAPHLDGQTTGRVDRHSRLDHLQSTIEHAAHLLPAQGPINVFIHHNTLHAFEDLSFDEGVKQGARLFGCHPYLPEDRYRQELARGRIRSEDLAAALIDYLGDQADALLGFLGTRFNLRLAMLKYPLRQAPTEELRWFVAETDALTRFREEVPASLRRRFLEETKHWILRDFRDAGSGEPAGGMDPHDDRIHRGLAGLVRHYGAAAPESWSERTWEAVTLQALWQICKSGMHGTSMPPHAAGAVGERHRDLLLEATGADSDLVVHDVLIRFCSAFLDQGLAQWPLLERDQGFFRAFVALYAGARGLPDVYLRELPGELARIDADHESPLESIAQSLEILCVPPEEWDSFVTASLLALRGWAGMIWQLETRGDRVAKPVPAGSLIEFLAVRLILDRLAIKHIAREALGFTGPLSELRSAAKSRIKAHEPLSVDQRAFLAFQLAQVAGWLPEQLYRLPKREWATLAAELADFPALARRQVFHAAFERRYRVQALDAITMHARQRKPTRSRPRFQVVCCLDEREESLRRHLEEASNDIETFGAAGFFAVAMYYRGAADAHYVPLCPIIIRPQHWVEESVAFTQEDTHRFRSRARRALGMASHQVHVGSRTFAGGALLTAGLGALASIPLVARVLFPRLAAQFRRIVGTLVETPSLTRLSLERKESAAGPAADQLGYSLDEMGSIAERLLRDIGLVRDFAKLVVVLGHGSSSMNNPHRSAYDCGACGGNAGGPNARAAATILNDPRIRLALRERGISIPGETYFIGGLHNTCQDSVTFFDLDRMPPSHSADFAAYCEIQDHALDHNAHERCRRFQSAPLALTPSAARRHVEERSEDLAQTRPECGHATNALCIVGRRSRTQGLFLDRRAFLTSYDPTQDDAEHAILTRILQAAVPVCAGINLEYYFSYVDSAGWGCSTKLPHNIASLLGVMDGAASDLRTGLPWQMVEIHEPVRLLFVVEATPETVLRIMERNEGIGKLVAGSWIQMATLDPDSPAIHLYQQGGFVPYEPETAELPRVASSLEWYRGWRDHLGFARIASLEQHPFARRRASHD